ncbi:hypothetical protein ACWEVD_09730 [Nocardia thailandica]
MVYVVAVSATELLRSQRDLRNTQRLTKAYQKSDVLHTDPSRMVIVVEEDSNSGTRRLAWLGVAAHRGVSGAFDGNITIDPLREVLETVLFSGPTGISARLPSSIREEFDLACRVGSVRTVMSHVWAPIERELVRSHPELRSLVNWIGAIANPPNLAEGSPADAYWQEERDALGTVVRIAGIQPTRIAAWRRPSSTNDPYLSGLIPDPVEASAIDHDTRALMSDDLFSEWTRSTSTRCDIQVFTDQRGRTIEIANVNATPVEARLGTDLIYYHEPTASFTLVQYKRLDPRSKTVSVDDRLTSQLARLEEIGRMGKTPKQPDDWRLGTDPCFVKLAYWSPGANIRPDALVPGMYMPVSYVRLLLNHESTLSGRTRSNGAAGRVLGYGRVDRHLTSTQFIDLVKNGLVGTVGVTREQLRDLVSARLSDQHSAMVAVDSGQSAGERQKQNRSRSRREPLAHRLVR